MMHCKMALKLNGNFRANECTETTDINNVSVYAVFRSKEKAPPVEEISYRPDEKIDADDKEVNGNVNEGFDNAIELEEKIA